MELLNSLVGQINDILWSYVLIILLIGAGIIFTIRTKFVQIRFIKEMIRLIAGDAGNKMEGQQISSFQAFCVRKKFIIDMLKLQRKYNKG